MNEALEKPGDISVVGGRRNLLAFQAHHSASPRSCCLTRRNAWRNSLGVLAVAAGSLISPATTSAQRQIDTSKSSIEIHVGKSGVFSGFAHGHDISAPISSGNVNTSAPMSVELRVDAAKLRVRDSDASVKDRNEIQATMLGPQVLDSGRYQEIVFKSGRVEVLGDSHWTVRGELTLHGQTRPVTVEVAEKAGHYTGRATVKQSNFGIKPVKVAGGTVKVKDEVLVEFDILLSR